MTLVHKLENELAAVERKLRSRGGSEKRREDAHQKIVLGGLIVKAGLREADPAFILGVLMEAAERMSDGAFKARMVDKGRKGFQS